MVGSKYYIYGGGRWREVDTRTGRVEGWSRARFLVARRGKLAVLRSRPVTTALRALAEAKPSAASEGPPLPYKFPKERRAHTDMKANGVRSCCRHCGHCKHCQSDITTSKTCMHVLKSTAVGNQCEKVETGIQTSMPHRDASSNKRKRDSTSSEDVSATKMLTVATVHTAKQNNSDMQPLQQKTLNSRIFKNVNNTVLNSVRHVCSVISDNQALSSPKRSSKKQHDLHKSRPLKRNRDSSKETSPTIRPRKSAKSDDMNKLSKTEFVKETNKYGPAQKKRQNNIHLSSESGSESGSESHASKSKTEIKMKANDSLVISSETDSKSYSKLNHKRSHPHSKHPTKHKPGPRNRQLKEDTVTGSQRDIFKELIIDEQDVEILRLYIQKHHSDKELLRFDTDNDYKMMHFYRINPLVSIERCPRIARMLRSESQDSQITVQDFASKLGLRSILEASLKPRKYRTRKIERKSYADRETSDSEDMKENFVVKPSKRFKSDKELRESLNSYGTHRDKMHLTKDEVGEHVNAPSKQQTRVRNKTVPIQQINKENNIFDRIEQTRNIKKTNRDKGIKGADKTMNTEELSSDHESEQFTAPKKPLANKPAWKRPKVTITKRPHLKEYSSLEDHAIVAWVSVGGRASCVNGNRLWRDLQQDYPRLTGQVRSFHSLRNRYLRYILPQLGALALPPAHQARLRAAAATGEMKKRKLASRRNSIFALPMRGAASRRVRAPSPSPTRTPSPAPPRPATRARRVQQPQRTKASPARDPRARHSSDSLQSNTDRLLNGRKPLIEKSNGADKPTRKFTDKSPEGSDVTYNNTSGGSSASSTPRSRSPTRSLRRSNRITGGESRNSGLKELSPSENTVSNSRAAQESTRKSLRHKSTDFNTKFDLELKSGNISVDSRKSPILGTKRRSLIGSMKSKTVAEAERKNQRIAWSKEPSSDRSVRSDREKERPRMRKLYNPKTVA